MLDEPSYRIARLNKALFITGALNVILASLLFYWMIREKPPAPYYELKPAEKGEQAVPIASDRSSVEVIRNFRKMSYEQLLGHLGDMQLVENGYTQRDLAVAGLVEFHQFDLSRALLGLPQVEKRSFAYGRYKDGSLAEILLYPGLDEKHFQAIVRFANTEKWPFTSQGIYLRLRQHYLSKESPDPTLSDAFMLTPEFMSVDLLFNRSEADISKEDLLKVLCEGDWKLLSDYAGQQRSVQDLTPARRQLLLLSYMERGSRAAAYMMLKTDGIFTIRKLDDRQVMMMLRLLSKKTPESEQFAAALLNGPRSDAVWKMAARRLYLYAGEEPPENIGQHVALERFVQSKAAPPTKTVVIVPPVKPIAVKEQTKEQTKGQKESQKVRLYIVREGDSLWKISRKINVDIETLRKLNKLESDFLKPGTSLKLP